MKPKQYSVAILISVVAIASTFYLNSLIAPVHADPAQAVTEISPTRYLDNVSFLASDAMRGRGDGSPELEKAADYVASQFGIWGLSPAGEHDTFFQSFDVTTGVQFGKNN